jgi:hypothetical protein
MLDEVTNTKEAGAAEPKPIEASNGDAPKPESDKKKD